MTTSRWMRYSLLLLFVVMALGNTKIVEAEGMGYSVRAIIPENQLDQSKTYFDLLVKPGETQQVNLEVTSTSKEPLELMITPYNATTNQNGELEFSVAPSTIDSTLLVPLTDLLSGSQSLNLQPMATKQVTFTLKVPHKPFSGKIVGGFTIYDRRNEQEQQSTSKNEVQIRNVFSMVIGIRLQEKVETIQPELVVKGVKADLLNYRTAMTVNLQNTEPTFLSQLKVEAKVRQLGSDKVLYEGEKSGMAMAPNSNFDFPIMLENQEIKAGKYVMDVLGTAKDQTWKFTKKFTISKEEASQLNKEALELEPSSSAFEEGLTIVLIISVLVVIIIMVVVTLSNRQRNEVKRCKKK